LIRAVIDVNVLVSALLTPRGTPGRILDAWQAGRFQALTSEPIVAVLTEKLGNPRIGRAYGVTEDDVRWVLALLRTQAMTILVPPAAQVAVTGDPEDDHVLATGVIGQADYLVTGDRGLLDLGTNQGVRILSPQAFLEILSQTP
jgi:uncharacterized protein